MRAAAILGMGCSPKQLEPFQNNTIEWRIGMPPSPNDADAILLFGGDGTIHRHLNQLSQFGVPLLVVPAGSGNDFAKALGIRSIRDALDAWRAFCVSRSNVRAIDLGVIHSAADGDSDRYFCCIAGVGLDSEVTRRANRLPRWLRGNGGYVLGLLSTVFTFAPFPMKILTSPDESGSQPWVLRRDQPTLLAAFANSPLYGGGMKIAPRAKMNDGMLDACVIGAIHPLRLARLFPTVYSGKHLDIREVDYFQAARFRIETEHPMDVYADGEYVCRTPVEISVCSSALNVICPST